MLKISAAGAEAVTALKKAFQDRANLIVAEAARTTAALKVPVLLPEMLAAFDRLFNDPVKTDPKCWGKTAIVKALAELDYDQSAPFLRGASHIQMEPVWGGQEDAASALRAMSVLALVQCSDLLRVEKLRHVVEALSDRTDPVRVEAVRALAQLGGDEAELLLRLKARTGDSRPLIVGHVFDALLALNRRDSLGFVAGYLRSADAAPRDEAALALGASRSAHAVRILMDAWDEAADREFRGVILRALSSSRDSGAIGFLLGLVKTGAAGDAALAREALKLHRDLSLD